MTSNHVLKAVVTDHGVKQVAARLGLSTSLVYKWCQPKDGPESSGADNPLDRLQKLMEVTNDNRPVEWLCQARGGFFVMNSVCMDSHQGAILEVTQKLLREFSDLLSAISSSYADDGSIDSSEAKDIRRAWEELKSLAEQFVQKCEDGIYELPQQENGATLETR